MAGSKEEVHTKKSGRSFLRPPCLARAVYRRLPVVFAIQAPPGRDHFGVPCVGGRGRMSLFLAAAYVDAADGPPYHGRWPGRLVPKLRTQVVNLVLHTLEGCLGLALDALDGDRAAFYGALQPRNVCSGDAGCGSSFWGTHEMEQLIAYLILGTQSVARNTVKADSDNMRATATVLYQLGHARDVRSSRRVVRRNAVLD